MQSQVLLLTLFFLLPEGIAPVGDPAGDPGNETKGDIQASSFIQPYDENPCYWQYEDGLHYQRQFIDKLLSVSLSQGNVLYNINNETDESTQWENYWAHYINRSGQEHGRQVYVTTMQFDPVNSVRAAMTYRNIYSFVEISQNNQDSRGARGRFMIDLDPWEYVEQVRIRWLDIEELPWSEPEVVEVQWDGDRSNWGHRGAISLKTPGNESYVALVEVVK